MNDINDKVPDGIVGAEKTHVYDDDNDEDDATDGSSAPIKTADALVAIAGDATLFHDHDGFAFADIPTSGHRETWPVRSRGFKRWLTFCYWKLRNSAPNAEAVKAAIGVIEAKAAFESEEHPVAVRVGGHDGRIYLDLCNDDWSAIEIDADGWRAVDTPPIRFVRSSGMLPLPMPRKGNKSTKHCIEALRDFINI